MYFLFCLVSASSGFPLPPHDDPFYCPANWYCKYLFFVNEDGVAPGEHDYFFRSYERGRFTRKRLGKKKYGSLMKEVAEFNGYDPKHFSGILFYFFSFFVVFC